MNLLKLALVGMLAVGLSAQTGTVIAGGRTITGPWDASGSTVTKPVRVVGSDPSGGCLINNEWQWNPTTRRLFACSLGTWYKIADAAGLGGVSSFNTRTGAITPDVTDYASFYASLAGSYANPSWITSLAGSKITGSLALSLLAQTSATTGQTLTWNGSAWAPVSLPGLSSLTGLLNPSQIAQGGATNGQALLWNGSAYAPGTVSGGLSLTANAQTGTTYTIASGDCGKMVTFSNASAVAVTLPQAGVSFPDGCAIFAKNIGTSDVTITPTTSTISGAASVVLSTGESLTITSNGTNYEGSGSRITFGNGIIPTRSRAGVNLSFDSTYAPTNAAIQAGTPVLCVGSGTAGAQTCNLNPAIASYATNMRITYVPGTSNTTTQTLAINGLSAVSILTHANGALSAGDLTAGRQYPLWYDGTAFRIGTPAAGGGSGTVTSFSATNPVFSVTNSTTTPTLAMDEIRLVETSGHTDFCTAAQAIDQGLYFGPHGIFPDRIVTPSGGTVYAYNLPCRAEITTANTTNSVLGIAQRYESDSLFFVAGTAGYRIDFFVQLPSVASISAQAGLTHTMGANTVRCTASATNCIAVYFDSSAGSTWQLRTCVSGVCGSTDTTVTATTSLTRLSIYSTTSGTVLASVNGSTAVSRSAPTATLGPGFYVETLTSATKVLNARGYSWYGARRLQ